MLIELTSVSLTLVVLVVHTDWSLTTGSDLVQFYCQLSSENVKITSGLISYVTINL